MPKQSHYKMDFAYVSCTALPHQCKNRRKVIHKGSSFRRFYPVRKGYRM